MNNTLTEREALTILNLLVASDFMLGCIDALRNTDYDRHRLKYCLNQLETELKKKIDKDLNAIWGIDDQSMYALQEQFKGFMHEFSTMRLEEIGGLGELIKEYKKAPALTNHRLGLKGVIAA